MDRIHYAGDSILTGTEIAHALLGYARALAQVGSSATVEIPTVDEHGEAGRSEILVGPASQLISDSVEVEGDEVIDAELVTELRRKTDDLQRFGLPQPAATVQGDDAPPAEGWNEFDDL
jgi:hypothetical protein